jgi:hypothetical protein
MREKGGPRVMGAYKKTVIACLFFLISIVSFSSLAIADPEENAETAAAPKAYIVLAWNTLGMHCYGKDYQDMAILPPYNTLWAQVVKVGEPPEIATEGLTVEYSFKENTYSAGKPNMPDKTNLWKYVKRLFNKDIKPDTGLVGKGLSGEMDLAGDHFIAEGIPLTEYNDSDVNDKGRESWGTHHYQLADIVVKDLSTGKELCRTTAVAPVSNELNCAKCHSDEGMATQYSGIIPTGRAGSNILAIHDKFNQKEYAPALMDRRPVLCAECHSSNALGAKGKEGIPSLSNAMHGKHKDVPGITPDTPGCYSCHPGSKTQCLRDTMATNYMLNCTTCHGTMAEVAGNKDPWLVEPRCDNPSCHGGGYRLDKPLYRDSKATVKIYCAGCHDSPHAIAPSREANDQIKFKELQGYNGTLRECAVCHGQMPSKPFKH